MVEGCGACKIGQVDGEGAGSFIGERGIFLFSKSGRRSNHSSGGRSVLLSLKGPRYGVSRSNAGMGEPSIHPSSTSSIFPFLNRSLLIPAIPVGLGLGLNTAGVLRDVVGSCRLRCS